MPGSNQRHVLAILRQALHLTQSELAEIGGCSPPAIQQIELLKLKLSPKLAAKIALAVGCDLDWLQANDITQPMPPIQRQERHEVKWKPKDPLRAIKVWALQDLFEWLFVIIARMPRNSGRKAIEIHIGSMLDRLQKIEDPKAQPNCPTSVFEFIAKHRELFDPDLVNIVNFDFLAADPRTQFKDLPEKKKGRGPKFTPRPNGQKPVSAKGSPSAVRSKRTRSRQ
jgi:transcriptional regulator with XRE-family HTH domain